MFLWGFKDDQYNKWVETYIKREETKYEENIVSEKSKLLLKVTSIFYQVWLKLLLSHFGCSF